MAQHKSQMVWFRYLYMAFSRYIYANTFVEIDWNGWIIFEKCSFDTLILISFMSNIWVQIYTKIIIIPFIINKFIKAESVQNLYEIMQIIKKGNRIILKWMVLCEGEGRGLRYFELIIYYMVDYSSAHNWSNQRSSGFIAPAKAWDKLSGSAAIPGWSNICGGWPWLCGGWCITVVYGLNENC